MVVVHLTASRFFGGPERQMIGLALSMPGGFRTILVSFSEDGSCEAFLNEARHCGIEARALQADTPHLLAARRELTGLLQRLKADVLCCHGYKANLVGRWAARAMGIPVVAVSRGWTGESWRVRLYEVIDRIGLRRLDRVVCVSRCQAEKVRQAGVPAERIVVIANAVATDRFSGRARDAGELLRGFFPGPRRYFVGAAGRLSPEKGFGVLVAAAARIVPAEPAIGFVIFGDGPLRDQLARGIAELGLQHNVVLAGFCSDLDQLLPGLDLLVVPSFTEGMPNVVLEAMAARVPVVATAVGGTPELVEDGVNGYLVRPGDPAALAGRILDALAYEKRRAAMGRRGRQRVEEQFTFAAQARKYQALFEALARKGRVRHASQKRAG
jgi:glycosyltransferase involved in cell wall biosynthesis